MVRDWAVLYTGGVTNLDIWFRRSIQVRSTAFKERIRSAQVGALKLQVLINVLVIVIVHRCVLWFETVVDSFDVLLSLYAKRIWKRESVYCTTYQFSDSCPVPSLRVSSGSARLHLSTSLSTFNYPRLLTPQQVSVVIAGFGASRSKPIGIYINSHRRPRLFQELAFVSS